MPRWEVDDQSTDLAFANRGQLGRDNVEMPVDRELGLRIEVMKATPRETAEILPQQGVVLGQGQVLGHRLSPSERRKRALSCSMTFSSAEPKEVSLVSGAPRASISRTRSSRILMARQSALAARLTSWVMIASRLVILRRPPFSATSTRSLSASPSRVERFFDPLDRPRGLPDRPFRKRV